MNTTLKNRVLSVLLALVMVLSMVPVPVFAVGWVNNSVAQVGSQTFTTLTDAIAAANGADITVLEQMFGENVVVEEGTTASIILGGLINEELWSYRWSGLNKGIPLTVNGGTVTLKDGVMAQGGGGANAKNAISLAGGTLTIEGDATKIIGANQGDYQCPAIEATGGTLVLNGNVILDGGLSVRGTASVGDGLKCGIFTNDRPVDEWGKSARVSVADSDEKSSKYTTVFELLAPGYVFAKYENGMAGAVIEMSDDTSLSEDVIVIACTHKDSSGNSLFMYGECAECGFTCEQHTLGDNGTCETCGEKFAAKDDKGNLYNLLSSALYNVATGGTVTVLADLSEEVSFNREGKEVTLNLDGHSLTVDYGFATLTVDDGRLTVINGAAGSAAADEPIRIYHSKNRYAINVNGGELILGSKLEANAPVTVSHGQAHIRESGDLQCGLGI